MSAPSDLSPTEQAIVDRTAAAGHEHCFAWWDALDESARRSLLDQLATIDFELVAELATSHLEPGEPTSQDLGPADVIRLPSSAEEEAEDNAARELGEDALAKGEVAVFLVAGGQGTRLGFDGPKGAFPIGPVENKTIFQLHAEKIEALRRRYGRPIPWYIMTSSANDAETQAFFHKHNYFGLPLADIMFFQQGMLPALDRQGRVIMDGKGHLHESPNGHGGSLTALRESGALDDMRQRGIVDLFYFQVDNVLTVMADPRFIGHHRRRNAEMSAKIIAKRSWDEKVGVLGTVNGTLGVIEYSDLGDEIAQRTDEQGRLLYWAGNEAVHAFRIDFIERITSGELRLPFHRAEKQVPCLNEAGNVHKPEEKNGIKFEMFVFDALGLAERTAILEVAREQDFAPVKNAEGEDSPGSAQQMLCNEWGRWSEEAGSSVPRDAEGNVTIRMEISPLTADNAAAYAARFPGSPPPLEDGVSL